MSDERVVRGEDGVARCFWGSTPPEYQAYHDTEWGFPVDDDRRLFEKLCLEGFQSGLSWLTILRKRDNFRKAFAGFDFERVARFGEKDVERLLQDPGIVRHRGKIEATINNAQRALELVGEEGSLAAYVWRFEPDPARAPRLALRRPDDGVRVHAGDGARERPPRGAATRGRESLRPRWRRT